jgi:hypothetical protein
MRAVIASTRRHWLLPLLLALLAYLLSACQPGIPAAAVRTRRCWDKLHLQHLPPTRQPQR